MNPGGERARRGSRCLRVHFLNKTVHPFFANSVHKGECWRGDSTQGLKVLKGGNLGILRRHSVFVTFGVCHTRMSEETFGVCH